MCLFSSQVQSRACAYKKMRMITSFARFFFFFFVKRNIYSHVCTYIKCTVYSPYMYLYVISFLAFNFFLFVGVVDSTHCVCANAFGAYRNTFQLYRGWSNIAHLCWLTAVLLAPSSSLSAADLSGRQRSLSIYRHITDIAIYPIPSLFSQWQKTAAHLNSNRRLSLSFSSLYSFFSRFFTRWGLCTDVIVVECCCHQSLLSDFSF